MYKSLILLVFILFYVHVEAQIPRQNIKGTVNDEASGVPVLSATVVLLGTNPLLGAITNEEGRFIINNVPVGRYDIQITFIGYEPVILKEMAVTSARETVVNIKIKEQVTGLGEVVIKSAQNKKLPLNSMAMASARMLSVEEAQRYAGGFDDPARLAASFAGVAGNMADNGIVIRGNAPKSLQWKLEGVEIPNPNHFADITSFGGGGLTALSSQMLANSDFFTGAFPAEYTNALSGVFDIFLRPGNSSHYEHTIQLGIIGIDVASEGPLKSKGASYLFNYRYSTLSLLTTMLPEDAQGTNYQDLSFKFNIPTKNSGVFSIWGIGLIDKSGAIAETDSTLWYYLQDKETSNSRQYMGAGGVTHYLFPGNGVRIKTTLAATITGLDYDTKRMNKMVQLIPQSKVKSTNTNVVLTSIVSKKFSAHHVNKTGITLTGLFYDMLLTDAGNTNLTPAVVSDEKGSSALLAAFTGSSYSISNRLTLNLGVSSQLFTLNNHYTLEPRAGLKWQLSPNQSLALAYGLHSRLERLNYYFTQSQPSGELHNKNLDFTKAHHLVLSYSNTLNDNILLKVEPYYQWLFKVPVESSGSFSFINLQDEWFYSGLLVNTGKGENYGIDITLEKFLSKGYYWLATGSVFNSKYKAGDNVWRNTRFNKNFILNLLAGKEWYLGNNNQNVLGINMRVTYQGGNRHSPINYQASLSQQSVVFDESKAYSLQLKPSLVAHTTLSFRLNRAKQSHEISLKMINTTAYKEFYGFRYNFITNTVDPNREAIIVPNLSYKIEF